MKITIDKKNKAPIYVQIKGEIKRMIYSRELEPFELLPSERKLAEELGVNRSTVLNAYRELKAEGLIDSHIGQGTQVMPVLNDVGKDEVQQSFPISWQHMLSQEALRSQDTSIIDMMKGNSKDKLISFAAGIAAPELYPIESFEAIASIFHEHTYEPFLHTPVEGLYSFREAICKLMERKRINKVPEEVMVLSGSQQGLDLLARNYLDVGDTVIVEEPTYLGAIQIFKAVGAKVIGVPVHNEGIRMDILETLIIKHKPKFIYSMPTFQNPSGRVMDLAHRLKLLELSYAYQVPIIEDDAYSELRYEGDEIPSLKTLDKKGNVLYLNTFSKCLFPGLRIGWLCAPITVIKQLSMKKQLMDLHANSLGQRLILDYLNMSKLEHHLSNVIKVYRNRRDIMISMLNKYAPEGVRWTVPEGGFYIWCEIPETINTRSLWMRAIDAGVTYVPGEAFFTSKQGQNFIRLNFSFPSIDEIKRGVQILMKVVEESLEVTNRLSSDNKVEVNPMF
ncbi:MAG: PLP-dependent aminotransferase family protein [Firmicutes bacterium HGW-Firmicutes-1]|jgi:DNA-binding transcriptional MocR family regulator|nr:MAG: PLP-dependent aminotransferase family protein [Firmicutes bacterium HGW-Firmicutes-1]